MNTLRDTRGGRNMTQEELAAKSGVAQTTISGLEVNLDRVPSLVTAAKLAKALRVSPLTLFPMPEDES